MCMTVKSIRSESEIKNIQRKYRFRLWCVDLRHKLKCYEISLYLCLKLTTPNFSMIFVPHIVVWCNEYFWQFWDTFLWIKQHAMYFAVCSWHLWKYVFVYGLWLLVSPWITEKVSAFSICSPNKPFSEGWMTQHPGAIPASHLKWQQKKELYHDFVRFSLR